MKFLIEKEDIENADWGRVALNNDNEIMLKGFLSTDMFFSGVFNETVNDTNNTITVTYEDGSEEVIHIPYDAETKAFKYIFSKPVGKMKLNPTNIYESITNFPNQSNLTEANGYFYECSAKSMNLRNFNSSKITNMNRMFAEIWRMQPTIDVSKMDTSSATDMSEMFRDTFVATLDLSSFDTSNVTNMYYMFGECTSLNFLNISGFDTSKVTDMSDMFSGLMSCQYIVGLRTLNTSKVTNMSRMFYGCYSTIIDVSRFDTSKVTDMSGMFRETGVEILDVSRFDTSKVTDMSGMFSSCGGLTSLDLSSFNTSNVTNMSSMFSWCCRLTSLDLSSFNTSNVTNMSHMFLNCENLNTINFGNFNVSNVAVMTNMFSIEYDEVNCLKLVTGTFEGTKVDLDLHYCPLTNSSAMVFINGLANVSETRQITFKSTTYDTLTPEQISVATSKGWTVVRHA